MRRFLVIRFSSIGDIILTTAAIRALKQQAGGHVTVLTKAAYAPLLDGNPNVDEVIVYEGSLAFLWPRLVRGGFTHIVDLHNNLRSRMVALMVPWVPVLRVKKADMERKDLIAKRTVQMPAKHVVDRHYHTIEKLGCAPDQGGLDYFVAIEALVDYRLIPIMANTFTAVVIGGHHMTKKLPEHKLVELLRVIVGPVVILGSEDEKVLGQKAAGKLAIEGRWNIYNACGELTIAQSASVMQQATEVYSHDTGLMHIAAALGKRVHTIWGSTVPAFGMYPYGTDFTVIQVTGLGCRPCHKHGWPACPLGHFKCMADQDFSLPRSVLNTHTPGVREKLATTGDA